MDVIEFITAKLLWGDEVTKNMRVSNVLGCLRPMNKMHYLTMLSVVGYAEALCAEGTNAEKTKDLDKHIDHYVDGLMVLGLDDDNAIAKAEGLAKAMKAMVASGEYVGNYEKFFAERLEGDNMQKTIGALKENGVDAALLPPIKNAELSWNTTEFMRCVAKKKLVKLGIPADTAGNDEDIAELRTSIVDDVVKIQMCQRNFAEQKVDHLRQYTENMAELLYNLNKGFVREQGRSR